MADQPKFVVVPVEPSTDMRIAAVEAIVKAIEKTAPPANANEVQRWMQLGATIRNSRETDAAYAAMLGARGPEAEQMVAVPKPLIQECWNALDRMCCAADLMPDRVAELMQRLRALLHPNKEETR